MKTFLKISSALVLLFLIAGAAFYLQPIWFNDRLVRFHMWRSHVESHYLLVDGYRIHYFEARPPRIPNAPPEKPLLLIHGLGGRSEDWSPLIPTLAAKGFHVYAPDLLGYGSSAQPDIDYSISTQEKLIVDLTHALGLTRVDLGGWSMGGWVALKLTADDPTLVDRLVVFDSAGVYFPPTFDASLFTPADATGLSRLQAILTPTPRPIPAFAVRDAIRRLHQNAWVLHRSFNSMETGHDLMDFRLHLITRPTLIVWGEKDALIPLSAGRFMHREIPDSSLLIIQGCGHLAPGECSKPILKGTLDFLKSPTPPRPTELSVPGATP